MTSTGGITTALNSSISSLKVNQEALSLIANNVANANTEGYTRREIIQSNQVVNGVASGVQIEEVRRAVDMFVVEEARRQISKVGEYSIQTEFFNRMELIFGQPGADNSIPVYFDNFFASLTDLSNSPELASVRATALESANTLANELSSLALSIENTRFDVDQEINDMIGELNNLLEELNSINSAIDNLNLNGGDKTTIFDSRDAIVSQISEIIEVSSTIASDGRVSLSLPRSEIISPTTLFQFSYTPAISVQNLINGVPTSAIEITLLDSEGNTTETSLTVKSASDATVQDNFITSGKLKGLIDLRDTELPKISAQLDELVKTFVDSFNAVHNDGGGFPPSSTLTGSTTYANGDDFNFSGNVMIAALGSDGSPLNDPYNASLNYPPLIINLDELNGGNGSGTANIDTIAREINEYFGAPDSNMATLGEMKMIRAAAVSSSITSTEATGTMLFSGNPGVGDTIDLDGTTFTFIANGTASNGTNIELGTTLAETLAEMSSYLNNYTGGTVPDATYTSNSTTFTITHNTAGTTANAFTIDADLSVAGTGETVDLNGLGAAANPAATTLGTGTATAGVDANGTFTFDIEAFNYSALDATIEVTDLSINGGAGTGDTIGPVTISAGERARTGAGATTGTDVIQIAIPAGLEEGDTFTLAADITVTNSNGDITTDTITFTVTVPDPNDNIINIRYPATAVSGGGDANLAAVVNSSSFISASVVDADGNAVESGLEGYLKLTANQSSSGIMIDEMDSSENGAFDGSTNATSRGLSHFFGLNDFFEYGGTLDNAGANFAIRVEYQDDSARLGTAELTLSTQPADPTVDPDYSYEIGVASNQLSNRLANLKTTRDSFDSAGTIPAVSLTYTSYASEIISFSSLMINRAAASLEQETILYNTFSDRLEESGGVNIDEELANTVLFQNNYNASARMISILSELFDQLVQSF